MKNLFRCIYLVISGMIVCASVCSARHSVQIIPIDADMKAKYEFLKKGRWDSEDIERKPLLAFAEDALKIGYRLERAGLEGLSVSDMTGNGRNEIVFVLDYGGTIGSTCLNVLYRVESGLMLQNFITIGASVKCFQDLNGDGVFEIIVQDGGFMILPSGPSPLILYPTVYAWDGSQWTEASAEFPEYYRALLKETRARIAELQAMTAEQRHKLNVIRRDMETEEMWDKRHEDRIAAHQLREAKLLSVLGDKTTGLNRADGWSKSGSKKMKGFALAILESEDSHESTKILQRLSEDPNSGVSRSAKLRLERRARKANSATPSPTPNASE